MRLLVANHIDPAVRDRGDLRAWTQRMLWFARDGDVVVLSDDPDPQFVKYVSSITGLDPTTLHVVVAPPGRHGGLLLDPESVASPELASHIRRVLGHDGLRDVEDVFALWPSASVSHLAASLGATDRFPGASSFAQGGGELCNSKAAFRALAAGAGVPIPAGAVCHNEGEAVAACMRLLTTTRAIVVKQAHNGAGVGNQLVLGDKSIASDHVGARHIYVLNASRRPDVEAYWRERWNWASAQGRFAVVVEEFVPHTASVYSEHYVADDGTHPTEMGTLFYVGRRLSHQVVPLRDPDPGIHGQLLAGGRQLAETYRAVGYRGYLSADAVVTPDRRVVFTEVNAQVSGSLHIYQVIAHEVVKVNATPRRSIVEYHVPPTWAVPDFETFLRALDELGCAFDPDTRTGVIVSMPITAVETNRAQFVFCIAYADEAGHHETFDLLDRRFAMLAVDGNSTAAARISAETILAS